MSIDGIVTFSCHDSSVKGGLSVSILSRTDFLVFSLSLNSSLSRFFNASFLLNAFL